MQSSDPQESPAPGTADQQPKVAPTPDSEEPRGIERGIADADKQARKGTDAEPVRNTPPAGAWNDTSSD
ncbi:MAG: hypothetical protein JO184_07775 [Gammaproteobacteria bacterium]|nr:hypothetical protein [Gammaproteobacteria bacterium]